MGRSYWFECSRCGYRAAVSGRPDRGPDFFVETISCRDCKKLYDAVVKERVSVPKKKLGLRLQMPKPTPSKAPSFIVALNRLPFSNLKQTRWVKYEVSCPVSPAHRVTRWCDPGPCPHCGLVIEKNPLPYRIWE
jgi:hypothetical protein